MNIIWTYDKFNVYDVYDNHQNVVYSYRYNVSVSDGVSSASDNGVVRLRLGELTNFVPFNQLTKEIIQGWTEATINTQSLISRLTENVIAKSASTTTNLPAPWES